MLPDMFFTAAELIIAYGFGFVDDMDQSDTVLKK